MLAEVSSGSEVDDIGKFISTISEHDTSTNIDISGTEVIIQSLVEPEESISDFSSEDDDTPLSRFSCFRSKHKYGWSKTPFPINNIGLRVLTYWPKIIVDIRHSQAVYR